MKATGIVRRIDDLGRVVIPREIRRSLGIRGGDLLEIYTDNDGSVAFRKYSYPDELNECKPEERQEPFGSLYRLDVVRLIVFY